MRAVILASAIFALAACSPEPATPGATPSSQTYAAELEETAAPASDTVPAPAMPVAIDKVADESLTPRGLGAIVIGKVPPSMLKADGAQISDGCRTFSDKARRIYAMTDGKVVARVTAMPGSSIKTERSIAPGASEAAVRKAYPEVTEQPHKYEDAPAKYLDWRPGGASSGLRFELDGSGKVGAIHAGRLPELEYVEGCA